jgi:hypothetical protein
VIAGSKKGEQLVIPANLWLSSDFSKPLRARLDGGVDRSSLETSALPGEASSEPDIL